MLDFLHVVYGQMWLEFLMHFFSVITEAVKKKLKMKQTKNQRTFPAPATMLLLQVLRSSLTEVGFRFMSNSAKQSVAFYTWLISMKYVFHWENKQCSLWRASVALRELFPSTLFILLPIFVKVFSLISGTQHNSGSLLLANEQYNWDALVPELSEAKQDNWYLKIIKWIESL